MIAANPDLPAGVALLADHLDSVLAIGEDILAERLAPRADLDETDPLGAANQLDAFVHRLAHLEAALMLRILQARRLAQETCRSDPTVRLAANLFQAETDLLADLVRSAGRDEVVRLARAGDAHAHLRSRGLIAPEAAAPSPYEALVVGEAYRVGGLIRLGGVLDMVASLLDLIDARFGLYGPDADEGVAAVPELVQAGDASPSAEAPVEPANAGEAAVAPVGDEVADAEPCAAEPIKFATPDDDGVALVGLVIATPEGAVRNGSEPSHPA